MKPSRLGDAIDVGGEKLRFVTGVATRAASRPLPVRDVEVLPLDLETVTIGRDSATTSCSTTPTSRGCMRRSGARRHVALADLGSTNGTFVDGRRHHGVADAGPRGRDPHRPVSPRLRRTLARGPQRARADAPGRLIGARRTRQGQADPAADVAGDPAGRFVGDHRRERRRKDHTHQGAGRSRRAVLGTVTINGEDLGAHRSSIGYVPQQEITHGRLTVREALSYGARLRLAADSSDAEVREACDRVSTAVADRACAPASAAVRRAAAPRRRRDGVARAARASSSSTNRRPVWTPASRRA